LTITSRCSVISPDCIQNVDNWQVPSCLQATPETAAMALAPLPGDCRGQATRLIRIGTAAWRVAPRRQRMVIRPTAIAPTSTAQPDNATPPEPRAPKSKDASATRLRRADLFWSRRAVN
jgi:hypothetical protein